MADGSLHWNLSPPQTRTMLSEKQRVVMVAGTRAGKCGRFNVLLQDGSRRFVKDVVPGDQIISLDERTLQMVPSVVTASFSTGIQGVFRVTTTSGREIEVTENHPFFTPSGWTPVKDMSSGDWLAVPRSLPVRGTNTMPVNEARLLGQLIADGGLTGDSVLFSKTDPVTLADFQSNLPDDCEMVHAGKCTWRVRSKVRGPRNSVKALCESWGICKLSKHKTMPVFVFNLTNDTIAEILSRLFDCDGWVDTKGIGYGSASKQLIQDIQHLLLRFGIMSRTRYKLAKCAGKEFDSWALSIMQPESMQNFANNMHMPSKGAKLDALLLATKNGRKSNTGDLIPDFPIRDCHKLLGVKPRNKQPWLTQHADEVGFELLRRCRRKTISRDQAGIVASYFGVGDALAFGDVYWDNINSIEPLGQQETYDITVDGTHNFIADDIFSHNTAISPLWLYREARKKGPGDYIVSAPTYPILHRGALKDFTLLFDKHFQFGVFRHNPLRFIVSQEGAKRLYRDTEWENDISLTDTVFHFVHASDPSALEAMTAKAAWCDEAGQHEFKLESYEAIERRVSVDQGRILITTTPYSGSWIKRRLLDPWVASGKNHPYIDVIQASSIDNPAFPPEEYWRQKEQMPFWRWDMMYNGNFTVPSGLIYDIIPEIDDRIRLPFFEPPREWMRLAGIDFGGVNTFVLISAMCPKDFAHPNGTVIPSGAIVIYKEYYPQRAMRIAEHIMNLHGLVSYIDRAVGGAKGEGQWRDEFWDNEMKVEEPPITSVDVGIQHFYSLLAHGMVFITDNCTHMWDDLYDYRYETDPETGLILPENKIVEKSSHHACDSARYLGSIVQVDQKFLPLARGGGERTNFAPPSAFATDKSTNKRMEAEFLPLRVGKRGGRNMQLPSHYESLAFGKVRRF